MAFGDLSGGQRLRILLELVGGPRYQAEMRGAAASTKGLGSAMALTNKEMRATQARSFLFSQSMYTLRRYAFFATFAITGLVAAVLKLGFSYDIAMQNARVSLRGFIPTVEGINAELRQMYLLAAKTPYSFQQIILTTRRFIPLVGSIKEANTVTRTLSDALAGMGLATDASMQRASLAIAHMYNIGRLTGRVLYQLGQDNIPMNIALQKAFHTTGEVIRQMVAGGAISAQQAMQALTDYVTHTKGYINAATRLANESLSGAWATFKDLMGAAFGETEGGLFAGLTKRLRDINFALIPMLSGKKALTLDMLVQAMDKALTPKTHILINAFIMLKTVIQDLIFAFKLEFQVIGFLIGLMNKVIGVFGGSGNSTRLLAHLVAVLTFAYITAKTVLGLLAIATDIYTARLAVAASVTKGMTAIQWASTGALEAATIARVIATGGLYEYLFATKAASTGGVGWIRVLKNNGPLTRFTRIMWVATAAVWEFTTGVWASTVALLANPITWIVVAIVALTVGLVILYFKWQAFHDAVNNTIRFLWNHPLVAAIVPFIGPLFTAIQLLKQIYDWIVKIKNEGFHPGRGKFWKNLLIGGDVHLGIHNPFAGGFQSGGTMPFGGAALVGERGPEIVHLPRGAHVTPHGHTESILGALGSVGGPAGQPIIVQMVLDKRVLEEVMVNIQSGRIARR